MDLREESARFFFMERKKRPTRHAPDSVIRPMTVRIDALIFQPMRDAPSPIAHGAPPDMPRSAVYGHRRPPCRSEAGTMRIVSAPEQICSSRRFQAEAHSPVPLCASPEKRVSAQRAALSARSL